ncbi:MAG: caspase family protein, partial [Verrucomicrobiota bacterium]
MMRNMIGRWLALLLLGGASLVEAEERTALLMGVWEYDSGSPFVPLPGIESDVEAMGKKLEELGFSVTVVTNPTLGQAKKAVDDFGAKLRANKVDDFGAKL